MPPSTNPTQPFVRPCFLYVAQCCAALMVAGLLVACGRDVAAPAATGAAPAPVSVHIQKVEPRRVPIRFDIVGQIEGSKQVEVRARVSGILQKQFYNEGDAVKQGAQLFEIDPAPYEVALAQARAQLAQATAQVDQARREEARLKPLVQDRAVSRKEYDDATSSRQIAEAAIQQANASIRQAELNLSYTRVTAPVPGISGRAEHSIGTLITTDANGSLLTTINQVATVWVRFSLAQADLAKLPGGYINRTTPVVLELLLADGSTYPIKGRLNFAATAIDTRLGTQQLRAEFDNPRQQLLPGQFVTVRITAGERDNVFLVPQTAVVQTEKGNLVFVVDADGKAQTRPVTTGDWIGKDWTILAGLNAGDKVVVDNLLKVQPGAPLTEAPPVEATATPAATPNASAKTGNK
ncbi:MAG: efflux RND transporter periplasmic adaptor subunit [Betaproteobacteria bacterium]|nr:MAG: efflux RND transporter periplasmic adaptor subunit [Betaproteobacteria bacterium]